MAHNKTTSWGGVAKWYGEHLEGEDTYHAQVVLPNTLRMLGAQKGERILDLACGEGFFARTISETGATVVGIDIAPELIATAKKRSPGPGITFRAAPAERLSFAKDGEFDAVLCVLALQNMRDIAGVFAEVRRVLKPTGRFVFVLNHPAFRVLRRSSWGWDEEKKVQYRRVDGYLSGAEVAVEMHPGKARAHGIEAKTVSYHRSLQDFFKPLAKAGFSVTKLEEWISHRQSEAGPRQRAEDIARKEIPLFMALEARIL